MAVDVPLIDIDVQHPAEAAVAVISFIYVAAALVNLSIPDTGARYAKQHIHPSKAAGRFRTLLHCAVARQARADFAGGHNACSGAPVQRCSSSC
jgi:hypothetical protein